MQNKSEQSTNFEHLLDANYLQCIQKLKQENQYLKMALNTAQSLIKNYQQENKRILLELKIYEAKQKKNKKDDRLSDKITLYKLNQYEYQKIYHTQSTLEHQKRVVALNKKIEDLADLQKHYQKKIASLQEKVTQLQKRQANNKINNNYIQSIYQLTEERDSLGSKQLQKNNRNFMDLKNFHLKLKAREANTNRVIERVHNKKGLVARVFSKNKFDEANSHSETKKRIKNQSFIK